MSSVSAFWRAGFIDFQVAGFAVLLAAPTAILGGFASHYLPGNWLLAVIGMALMVFAYLLLRESTEEAAHLSAAPSAHLSADPSDGSAVSKVADKSVMKEHHDRKGRVYRYRLLNDRWRASTAGFGGILQGLVGFSSGELSTVEQVLRGMPVRIAAGNSHLIIFAASISAAFAHVSVSAAQGTKIPWNIVAATAPAMIIGGQLAGILAGRIPQEKLRLLLSGFLMFIGAVSAYRAFVALGIHLPGWILWITLLVCLAGMPLFVLRRKRAGIPQELACACSCSSCGPEDQELGPEKKPEYQAENPE